MTFMLTPMEQTLLIEILEDSLLTLRTEISRTDSRQFRTRLRERERTLAEVLERLRGFEERPRVELGRQAG